MTKKTHKKQKWGKPELIVLVRVKPEESAATQYCRIISSASAGNWNTYVSGCTYYENPGMGCGASCNVAVAEDAPGGLG